MAAVVPGRGLLQRANCPVDSGIDDELCSDDSPTKIIRPRHSDFRDLRNRSRCAQVWRAWGQSDGLDVRLSEDGAKGGAEPGVAIHQDMPFALEEPVATDGQIPGNLLHPLRVRIRGGTGKAHSPRGDLHDEEQMAGVLDDLLLLMVDQPGQEGEEEVPGPGDEGHPVAARVP